MNKTSLLIVALLSASVATTSVVFGRSSENDSTSPACVARNEDVAKAEQALHEASLKLTEAEANLAYAKDTSNDKCQIAGAAHKVDVARKEVKDLKAAVKKHRKVADAHCQPVVK